MITFTMIVTIWMGPAAHKFNVWTSQRFHGPGACERAMERTADIIRARAVNLKSHPKFEIARACKQLITRET